MFLTLILISALLTCFPFPILFCPNSQGPNQRGTSRTVHLGRRSFPEHGTLQIKSFNQWTKPRLVSGRTVWSKTQHVWTHHQGKRNKRHWLLPTLLNAKLSWMQNQLFVFSLCTANKNQAMHL